MVVYHTAGRRLMNVFKTVKNYLKPVKFSFWVCHTVTELNTEITKVKNHQR